MNWVGAGGAQFSPGQFVERNDQTHERNKSETVKRLLVCLRINLFFFLLLMPELNINPSKK